MPEERELTPVVRWTEVSTTTDDWKSADPAVLGTMLVQMNLIRAFEEKVLDLAGQGLIHGPAHSSIGQEGGAVGSVMALSGGDRINGSHRGHHQFLAKAIQYVAPGGLDPREPTPDPVREVVARAMAEICGLRTGFCGGRGGSMHLQWMQAGAMGTNAIVGGAVPQAGGFAWAGKRTGDGAVSVTYFGDGAINIGSTLETLNLAAAWKLPVCFFIENNQYAVSTTVTEATGESRLSGRGPGFGIPSWRVDGMDPLAVKLAMDRAVGMMRAGEGPTLVEASVYRYFHQNGPFPGSAFGYRSKEEEQQWRDRDPLQLVATWMTKRQLLTDADVSELRTGCRRLMEDIASGLLEPDPAGRPGSQRYRPELQPDPGRVDEGIRGDLSEFAGAHFEEPADYAGPTVRKKFVDVVADVLARRMQDDPSIIVMGEDVHKLKGGPRGATRGLADTFGDRVIGTPICENAFLGLAGGIALDGRFRPVVEFMYADFIWVAADQLFNQIGRVRHMFGGDHPVPLVLRIKIGTGTGYGSQHSMDPAGLLAHAPGWRIAAPATHADYIGLLNSALRCQDPVAILEHDADLYKTEGDVPAEDLDYCIPIGSAALRRTGSQVTVISYLSMVQRCIAAAESAGTDADIIDLRWLDRASVDWDTIGASVKKTNAVVLVEQGSVSTSYGGWLADEIHRRFFDWLDQPVHRVTGGVAAPSVSRVLERAALADVDDIAATLAEMRRSGGMR